MNPLTVHLLVKNNELTIQETLNSVSSLNCRILVADIGSSDNTIDICKRYDAEIIKLSLNDDLSQVRNKMIEISKSKWILQINPWETIISNCDVIINSLGESNSFNFSVLQGDVITKQIRLWHKDTGLTYINPVFETLKGNAIDLPVYIASREQDDIEFKIKLLKKWREKSPLSNDATYYLTCCHLVNKNWDSFLNLAEVYLHQEKKYYMSFYMTQYYCSMVNCYIKKQYNKAIKFLLPCIVKKPTMAEFWCLLGDIYYAIKDYDRAKVFYENAIILGSRRLKNDDWPLEISKYKEYPQKMIEGCISIIENQTIYATNK